MDDITLYKQFQKSPKLFIEYMWKLTPQPDNGQFERGKNLTWQQNEILSGVELALSGKAPKRISVRSGHGIGKTATLSWLLLWYLFCFKDAQIPCTAPTADQVHDVLWKECQVWIQRMPPQVQALYEWSNGYIRIKESPETWFARAKTARKEAPEALAGIHGDYVMMLVDEASGIPEEIFATAEGALTSENILVILISNPTRNEGYFYETHHKDKRNWQTFHFSSLASPVVDLSFVNRIKEKYGEDSDEYRIRVLGQFPDVGIMDDLGFVPLLAREDIRIVEEAGGYFEPVRMGIDPSGEGQDATAWVKRDNYKAEVVGREKVSNPKSIAEKTLTLMDYHGIFDYNVMVDNFGVGADVGKELALSQEHPNVGTVNVGEKPRQDDYINLRAEAYYAVKTWLRNGGSIVRNEYTERLIEELLSVKFKRTLQGKIQIMGKERMAKEGIPSPNFADALMLTFVKEWRSDRMKAKQYVPKGLDRNPAFRLPK